MAMVVILLFGFLTCYAIRMDDTDLVELGKQINDTITNPRGKNLQLTRDCYVYLEELGGIRHDMRIEMPYTFKVLQRVKDDGGPPHIKYDINITKLDDYFHWTRWEEEEFCVIINNTKKEWNKLLEVERGIKKKYLKVGEMVD